MHKKSNLKVKVWLDGENFIPLTEIDSAILLLTLYSDKYLTSQLPNWMVEIINQLTTDQKAQILRDGQDPDNPNWLDVSNLPQEDLDLDAESERLCGQLEEELNNPVEASESEREQTDEDYDVMPF